MLRIVNHVSEAATPGVSLSAHTHQDLTAIPTCKQHFCLYACSLHADTRVHAHRMPHLELYFGHSHSRISSHLPFHSSGLYVSLLLLLQHPLPRGDSRLLGCQAAEPSEMGGMTTYIPPGVRPGTGGEIGRQNGGTEKKVKETRERRSERSYSLSCDLTPQGNTVCECRQKGKVLNHLPASQFPFAQSDILSPCPGGYGAHTSDIVHFNAISTTIL